MGSLGRLFTSSASEYFSAADSATLSTGDISWTIAGFVWLDSVGVRHSLVSKSNSAAVREYEIYVDTDNQLKFEVYNSSGTSVGIGVSVTTLKVNRWYFFSCRREAAADGSNHVAVKINTGASVGTALTDVPSDTAASFGLGARNIGGTPASFLNGRLARVGFWKSRRLSDTEADQLANGGHGYLYSQLPAALQTNLTCYWNLDQASGNESDSVGSQTLTDVNTVGADEGPDRNSWIYAATGFEAGEAWEFGTISGGGVTVQSSIKRSGTYALRANCPTGAPDYGQVMGHAENGGLLSTEFAHPYQYFRFYFRYATKPSGNSARIATASTGAILITSTGTLTILDGVGGTEAGAVALTQDTWYRIEWYVRRGATGTSTVRIYSDGGTLLETITDASGNYGAGDIAGYILLGKSGEAGGLDGAIDAYYDDVACSVGSWIGPGSTRMLLPTGAGTYTAWTGTFADCDEIPTNGDTSYVSSATAGQIETFTLQTFANAGFNPGTINFVKLLESVRDEGGASNVSIRVKSGSTEVGGPGRDLGAAYVAHGRIFDWNPDSVSAWTKQTVQNFEIGIANAANVAARMSACVLMVDFLGPTVRVHPVGIGKVPKGNGGGNDPEDPPSQNFLPIPPGVMGFEGTGAPFTPDQGGNPTLLSEGVYWHTGLFSEGPYVGVGWSSTTNLTDGSANDTTTRETSGDASISILTVGAGAQQLDQLIAMLRYKGNIAEVYKEWTGSAYEDIPIDIAAAFPPNATYTDGSGTTIFDTNSETIRLYQFTESDTSGGGMSASDIRETLS